MDYKRQKLSIFSWVYQINIFKLRCSSQFCVSFAYAILVDYLQCVSYFPCERKFSVFKNIMLSQLFIWTNLCVYLSNTFVWPFTLWNWNILNWKKCTGGRQNNGWISDYRRFIKYYNKYFINLWTLEINKNFYPQFFSKSFLTRTFIKTRHFYYCAISSVEKYLKHATCLNSICYNSLKFRTYFMKVVKIMKILLTKSTFIYLFIYLFTYVFIDRKV